MAKLTPKAKKHIENNMKVTNRDLSRQILKEFNLKVSHVTVGRYKKTYQNLTKNLPKLTKDKKPSEPSFLDQEPIKLQTKLLGEFDQKPMSIKTGIKDFILAKEGDLIQIIIDINQERIQVPDYVRHFFQHNTTDRGPFRGKRDFKKGGRTDGTVRQVINALVDSQIIFIRKDVV